MPSIGESTADRRPDIAGAFMEFDNDMNNQGFISHRVLPVTTVAVQNGQFRKVEIESLLQEPETARAPGAGYNRGKWKYKKATFATEEHGWEEPIDDRLAAIYNVDGNGRFSAEVISATRARGIIMRGQEMRVASAIFNSSTWTGSALTTGISTEWSTVATAVPITDVNAARLKVWEGSGLWPNALIITKKVFHNLRNCTQIKDAIASSGAGFPSRQRDITAQQLAEVFDLDQIIVGGMAKNSANEGQAVSIAPIWDDEYAMVCRVATSNDIEEPCIGRIFHWAEDGSEPLGTIETYRSEEIRGDVVRVRHDVDEVVLFTEAGHLLSNVTA